MLEGALVIRRVTKVVPNFDFFAPFRDPSPSRSLPTVCEIRKAPKRFESRWRMDVRDLGVSRDYRPSMPVCGFVGAKLRQECGHGGALMERCGLAPARTDPDDEGIGLGSDMRGPGAGLWPEIRGQRVYKHGAGGAELPTSSHHN
jgi:hypothetical protein